MEASSAHKPPVNRLRALWESGGCAYGVIATMPSVQAVQVLARSGLDCMIIDMEHGRADAENIVRAVRYPPRGERYWGFFYAPLQWGMMTRDYLDKADDDVLAVGVIEHIEAVEMAGEIVSTPDLDIVFVGPGDLATSMGCAAVATMPMFIRRTPGSSRLIMEARSCSAVLRRIPNRPSR